MVKPSDRRLNKKFVKLPGGKTVERRLRPGGKQTGCALCDKTVQGTPKGHVSSIRKLSKTEKRPSAFFGGTLCNKCRDLTYEKAIMVKTKTKDISEIKISERKYVEIAMGHIEL